MDIDNEMKHEVGDEGGEESFVDLNGWRQLRRERGRSSASKVDVIRRTSQSALCLPLA